MKPQMQHQETDVSTQDDMIVAVADLGDVIRGVRREQGLSQEEVARMLGLQVDTISKVENRRFGRMLRLRKCILKRLAGYTLDGPYYQIRPIEND